jgi:hypothetical protein
LQNSGWQWQLVRPLHACWSLEAVLFRIGIHLLYYCFNLKQYQKKKFLVVVVKGNRTSLGSYFCCEKLFVGKWLVLVYQRENG